MKKIYSKVKKNKLLHIIVRKEDTKERLEIVPKDNFIQCTSLKMKKGKKFNPHFHITKKRSYENKIAQESWIVISGKVKCTFYDLDNSLIDSFILEPGDASFTLFGGHSYEILEEDTFVFEYKTGPYEGKELDRVDIKDG
jgi:hypothetical protein